MSWEEMLDKIRDRLISECEYIQYKNPGAFLDCNNDLRKYVDVTFNIPELKKELKRLEDIDAILGNGGGIWAENGIIGKKLAAFEVIKKLIEPNWSLYEMYLKKDLERGLLTEAEFDNIIILLKKGDK